MPSGHVVTDKQKDTMMEMGDDNHTINYIAKKTGLYRGTVRKWMRLLKETGQLFLHKRDNGNWHADLELPGQHWALAGTLKSLIKAIKEGLPIPMIKRSAKEIVKSGEKKRLIDSFTVKPTRTEPDTLIMSFSGGEYLKGEYALTKKDKHWAISPKKKPETELPQPAKVEKERTIRKSYEFNYPADLRILHKADNDLIIGGYASTESTDKEGDSISLEALEEAFQKLMEDPEYRNLMVQHHSQQGGVILPEWKDPETGKLYRSGVDEHGLFVLGKIRNDGTRLAQGVRKEILEGKLNSFSIGGTEMKEYSRPEYEEGKMVNRINKIELHEVTLCREGMNSEAWYKVLQEPKAVAS